MAKLFVPLLGLGAAYALVAKVVIPPFRSVREQAAELRTERDTKMQQIAQAEKALVKYRQLCSIIPGASAPGQPPLSDQDRTEQYLKQRVEQLMDASGFRAEKFDAPSVDTGKGRGEKKELDKVTYGIEGRSDLRNVMQLVVEAYRSNDLVSIGKVTIEPDKTVHDANVKAVFKFETLVIPREDKLLKLAAPNEGAKQSDGEDTNAWSASRLAAGDYDRLLGWRPFAPQMDHVVTRGPDTETNFVPGETTTEVPAGNLDRHNLVVRGTFNDEVLVVKKNGATSPTDPTRPNPDRLYFKVGQEFDGGKLIKVHRLGLVVSKKNGDDAPAQEWIYQLDQALADCRLLEDIAREQSEFRQIQLDLQKRSPAGMDAQPTGQIEIEKAEPELPTDQLEWDGQNEPVEEGLGGNEQEEPCDEPSAE